MSASSVSKHINVAIAGLGNCASSLIEGICFYRQHPTTNRGLLFPELGGYCVCNIDVVVAFDMSVTTSCGKLPAHQNAMTEGLKNNACSRIMGDEFAAPYEGASDVVQPRRDCTADAQ